jgi:hypothetical protein
MDKSKAELAIGASIALVILAGFLKLPDIIMQIFIVFFIIAVCLWKFSS